MKPARFLYDTNCLIALAAPWHEFHHATRSDWLSRAAAGGEMVLAAPCALEAYAVLTGLPARQRRSPADAWEIVRLYAAGRSVAGLTAAELLAELGALAARGVAGGQVYDGLIAACARKAGVATLVTWNLRHFARFAAPGLAVVSPSA
jgi:predicted nucleic acid-binding protein